MNPPKAATERIPVNLPRIWTLYPSGLSRACGLLHGR